jgi:hypothetical protein
MIPQNAKKTKFLPPCKNLFSKRETGKGANSPVPAFSKDDVQRSFKYAV